jgi:hypothetical protein
MLDGPTCQSRAVGQIIGLNDWGGSLAATVGVRPPASVRCTVGQVIAGPAATHVLAEPRVELEACGTGFACSRCVDLFSHGCRGGIKSPAPTEGIILL